VNEPTNYENQVPNSVSDPATGTEVSYTGRRIRAMSPGRWNRLANPAEVKRSSLPLRSSVQ